MFHMKIRCISLVLLVFLLYLLLVPSLLHHVSSPGIHKLITILNMEENIHMERLSPTFLGFLSLLS